MSFWKLRILDTKFKIIVKYLQVIFCEILFLFLSQWKRDANLQGAENWLDGQLPENQGSTYYIYFRLTFHFLNR